MLKWQCVGYLAALVQEGVPQRQQDVTGQTLHKNHQEPVEGDERHVDTVLLKVSGQPGKLLSQEVLQHPLVGLRKQSSSNFGKIKASKNIKKS